jgi:hypothetical protein
MKHFAPTRLLFFEMRNQILGFLQLNDAQGEGGGEMGTNCISNRSLLL